MSAWLRPAIRQVPCARILILDYTPTNSPNYPQSIQTNMADPKFLSYVDEHQEQFIDRLAEAVAIPS